mgnify:CR=1 FL=1
MTTSTAVRRPISFVLNPMALCSPPRRITLSNYTAAGDYDYKGLHCAIAGKSVAALFSEKSDYSIRFTNLNPRNIYNTPDAYAARSKAR